MPIHLRVVHTDDVNAFATAGGNVYVFTGLIAAAENESQLAGVLSHELSHVVARHVTEGATRNLKLQLGTALGALAVGSLADLKASERDALIAGSLTTAGVVGMKYDRRMESEADLLGEQYLWRGGWDPEGIARFFQVLSAKKKASPPGWLSTHPTDQRRIASGLHWSRAFLPKRERYLVDTRAFQDVKRRVAALPPPRKKSPLEDGEEGDAFAELLGATSTFRRVVARELGGVVGGESVR
jgi:predicted Zn-dependent protease